MRRLWNRWGARAARDEEGQSAVEYAAITAAIMGGTVMSWPFFVELMNAFDVYYQSIYWVIQSPIP